MAHSVLPAAFRPLPLLLLLLMLAAHTATLATGTSDFHEWDGYVIDLNDANFDENLDGREVVVNFFAPWCGSCQQFKPVYADFADALYHEPSGIRNVVVTRVDCTLNPETCTARQVQAYPSVQFFRDGAMIGEYVGDRSVDDLLGWIEELSKQADLGAGRHHQHQQQQQHAQQKQQRPSKDGAAAAQAPPPQGQAQAPAGAGTGSGKTSGAAPSGSILPDWRLSDLTDLMQLKRHIAAIADLPMVCTHILGSDKTSLFQSHPWMVISIVWTLGLFQGVFFGIVWALREKR